MATVHRISEELLDDSFGLIALHCNMECYALAYHINQVVHTLLVRAKADLGIAECSYPVYEYRDDINDQEWYLVSNVVQQEKVGDSGGLFQNSNTIEVGYLLEERKEIDYLLKVYPEDSALIGRVIGAIRSIPKVRMAYELNIEELKSKRNLIF